MTILRMALKQRNIPSLVFNPVGIVVVLIVLTLVSRLAFYAAELAPVETERWTHFGLYAVGTIGKGVAWLMALVLVWRLAVKAWRWIAPAVDGEEAQPESAAQPQSEPAEAGEIATSLQALTTTLAQVEQDKNAATLLMTDARTQSTLLVAMIKAIAQKAEAYERQGEELDEAMAAIADGDPVKVAQAAGRVSDQHIRELMLCDVKDPGYWQNVARTIAAECGTLQQWAEGYKRFSGRLLLDFSRAKAQLTALNAASDLVDVARPLATINRNVDAASKHLQLNGRPGLAAAGELPAFN